MFEMIMDETLAITFFNHHVAPSIVVQLYHIFSTIIMHYSILSIYPGESFQFISVFHCHVQEKIALVFWLAWF
jgi:urate oxidase